jgi:hypothetical protein
MQPEPTDPRVNDCPVCGPDDDCDPERHLEAEYRMETGSRDPQGPPIGWKPKRRYHPDA